MSTKPGTNSAACAARAPIAALLPTVVLRQQMRPFPGIKVIEILPPAVQTELHDAKHQPDIKDGGKIGMPLKDFTDEAWEGLVQGKEQIPVGMSKRSYGDEREPGWEMKRQEMFGEMVKMMEEMMKGK